MVAVRSAALLQVRFPVEEECLQSKQQRSAAYFLVWKRQPARSDENVFSSALETTLDCPSWPAILLNLFAGRLKQAIDYQFQERVRWI